MPKHQLEPSNANRSALDKPSDTLSSESTSSTIQTVVVVFAKVTFLVLLGGFFSLDWTGADGWWITWISMAGFLTVAARSTPRGAALYALLFGAISLGLSFSWAEQMLAYVMNQEGTNPRLVFSLLVAWESLLFVIVGYSVAATRQRHATANGMLIPICLWIVLEAFLPRVFRWTLAHSQLGALTLVQSIDLGGTSTVSLMVLSIAFLPTLICDLFSPKTQLRRSSARRGLAVCAFVFVATLGYGIVRTSLLDQRAGTPIQIGVVQEDPSLRVGLPNMRGRSLAMKDVELFIWPESTLGVHSGELTSFADPDHVLELSKPPMINSEYLVGLPASVILGGRSFYGDRDTETPVYQTAFLVDTNGEIVDRYHKRSLLPLGEYVPGEKTYPELHDWFQLGEYFEPGTSDSPLTIPGGHKIGVIICYEDTLAEVTRKTVAAGAELLVCIINDSAFESPVARRQHLKLARLRAIENRRYLVRSAGTGVSCIINPWGSYDQYLDADLTGAFQSEVYLRRDKTLYQVLGNWPAWVAIAVLVGAAWANRRTSSKST